MIVLHDLKKCFDKDEISLFQPKNHTLGDIFIHLTKADPKQFQKLSSLSWVLSSTYDTKGFLNIRLKDDILMTILNKTSSPQSKNYLLANIQDFNIQYCYARCYSIFKEASSMGLTPPYKIRTLNSLAPIMRYLLIHLLCNHLQHIHNPKEIIISIRKIATLFDEAWAQNTGTRLRFIDERDMTKTHLNLAILTIVKTSIDHHLARIDTKVLDELNI